MADDFKKPRLAFTTPTGFAVWPFLNTPHTKHAKKDTDGVFKVDLAFDDDDPAVKAVRKKLEAFQKEARASEWGKRYCKKAYPTHLPLVPEKGEEDDEGVRPKTGRTLIRTKLGQYVSAGKGKGLREQRIQFYDTRPQMIGTSSDPDAPRVGAGSMLRVSVDAVPNIDTTQGDPRLTITLYIAGIQIVKLEEWGKTDPIQSHGMDAVDDGYVATLTGQGEDTEDYQYEGKDES